MRDWTLAKSMAAARNDLEAPKLANLLEPSPADLAFIYGEFSTNQYDS
jgi:hypothetical protein